MQGALNLLILLISLLVVTKPPYEITETGWGEFEIIIKIFFIDPNERPVSNLSKREIEKLFCAGDYNKLPMVRKSIGTLLFHILQVNWWPITCSALRGRLFFLPRWFLSTLKKAEKIFALISVFKCDHPPFIPSIFIYFALIFLLFLSFVLSTTYNMCFCSVHPF